MSDAEQDPHPADDEAKRRFKEALDRKHGRHATSEGGPDGGSGSRIHEEHGPAASRRQFRRKAGG